MKKKCEKEKKSRQNEWKRVAFIIEEKLWQVAGKTNSKIRNQRLLKTAH